MGFSFEPIGYLRTAFPSRAEAPRQPYVADGAPGVIELLPGRGFEDALLDLGEWSHLWVVYVFHENLDRGWRPRVLPPRSRAGKRGLFSTRSPHRPNPIGLSLVGLDRVEGLHVHVRGVDAIDQTPVLDIKPYLPFAESIPDATTGWIGKDPDPPYAVQFSERALAELGWLEARGVVDLRRMIVERLAIGPEPRPYRRIKAHEGGFRLAVHAWRVDFTAEGRVISVGRIVTGYKSSNLTHPGDADTALHRDFVEAFAADRAR